MRQVQLLSSESLQFDISMQFFFPEKKASIQNILSDWIFGSVVAEHGVCQWMCVCVHAFVERDVC